jgi:hypothetical protein
VVITITPARWWTEADKAELSLLVYEFTGAVALHDAQCGTCRARGEWCAALSDACNALLEWREGRMLASKAAFLRSEEVRA